MSTQSYLRSRLERFLITALFIGLLVFWGDVEFVAQETSIPFGTLASEKPNPEPTDLTKFREDYVAELRSKIPQIQPRISGNDRVARSSFLENSFSDQQSKIDDLRVSTDERGVWNADLPLKQKNGDQKFHWKGAIAQSLVFLGIQHGFRLTEEKTRDGFKGPFFSDWRESVANLEGWDDGGKWFTNYVAHPLQGAITSRIFINNSDNASSRQFGKSKAYWTSRLKSMAWAAVWSAQFEIGPISEASLGNVGLVRHDDGRSKLTYIDFVITPVLGTSIAVAEDAIERYIIIGWAEKKLKNRLWIKFLRTVLTPTTSFANITRFRAFWWRPGRLN